jgi:hypothetical protein
MALAQLVYVSRRDESLQLDGLERIVARSKARNAERNITGVLLCHGVNLMQLLEGELSDVVGVYETIRVDPRHRDVRCLVCKNVSKRIFPDWAMALADLESPALLNRDRLVRLLHDIGSRVDTSHYGVEARLLLNDFRQQLGCAA